MTPNSNLGYTTHISL